MQNKNPKSTATTLLFAVLLFLTAYPHPGNAETEEEPVPMDAIVVSAPKPQRSTQTGDVSLETTTSFFTLITRDKFEGKTDDLGELISKEVGVQVRQTGGLGSYSTVSLRGSSSDQVMVYLDGILLNDASGGGVDLSTISLSDVESIEIYRGMTPAVFGKSSVGGVVNIRTRRAQQGIQSTVTAGYGSFETWNTSGFLSQKPGKWDYLISANYQKSKNNFTFLNDNHTPLNPADDREEERHNAQFDETDVLAKAGYDFSADTRIDLMDQWFSKDQGLPSWNNSELSNTSFATDRNIASVKFTSNDLGAYHLNTSTFLDYMRKVETYKDLDGQVGLGRQHNRYTTDRYGGHTIVDWHTSRNTLSLMLDAQRETYAPEDLLNPDNHINESSRDSLSIGLQDSYFLFQEKLIATPLVRYTRIHDDRKSGVNSFGTPEEGSTVTENNWSPQLGVKYRPFEWLTLKTNVGQYVREPSFYELFGDRGYLVGNSDLESEKGTNFDVGFEAQWTGANPWLQKATLGSVFFYNSVDDLITWVYDARGVGRSVNISSSLIQGVETTLSLEFLKHFRLIGNITFQNPVQQNEIQAFDGKILPGRAQELSLIRLEAFHGSAKVYAEYITEAGLFYDTANLLEAPNKEQVNLGLSFVIRSLTITIEAKNVTDDRYQDFNGYPMPGRSGYISAQYKFK